jgi:hypothetical protein
LTSLPFKTRKALAPLYNKLTQDCLDKIIGNLEEAQPIDRVVSLFNVIFSDEVLSKQLSLQKFSDDLFLSPQKVSLNLVKEFCRIFSQDASYLHDVHKQEVFTLINRVFRTHSSSASDLFTKDELLEVKGSLFQALCSVPLINSTYHHEIWNRHIVEGLGELTRYVNENEGPPTPGGYHWHKFVLMHSVKNVVETKSEFNTANFKSYMSLLGKDLRSCDPERPLCFLSRQFDN